jgi:hypothetical protein
MPNLSEAVVSGCGDMRLDAMGVLISASKYEEVAPSL